MAKVSFFSAWAILVRLVLRTYILISYFSCFFKQKFDVFGQLSGPHEEHRYRNQHTQHVGCHPPGGRGELYVRSDAHARGREVKDLGEQRAPSNQKLLARKKF